MKTGVGAGYYHRTFNARVVNIVCDRQSRQLKKAPSHSRLTKATKSHREPLSAFRHWLKALVRIEDTLTDYVECGSRENQERLEKLAEIIGISDVSIYLCSQAPCSRVSVEIFCDASCDGKVCELRRANER